MLIEITALSSILYVGFKNFKKQEAESAKRTLRREGNKNLYEKKIDQMYQDANKDAKTLTTSPAQTFDKMNNREIISAVIALGFASGGLFYAPLAFGSIPFILYSSQFVIREAYVLIKKGKIDIETLVSTSVIGTILLKRFFIASLAIFFFKLSFKLTALVINDSRHQLVDIFSQTTESVWVLVDGTEMNIPFHEIKVGDIIIVRAGDAIPVDGRIFAGMATVDQHILTGEAMPVEKGVGEEVFAMTLVLSGQLQIKVEKAGEESTVAKINQILNSTSDFKSSTQLRAERFSRNLINPTLIASGVALPIVGFNGALGVLESHPTNTLISIAPISILKHLNLAYQQGILIKDGRSLELLNKVDTIVFDKTGTLTEEQPHTEAIHCFANYSENEVLSYAGTAEYKQTHPLAKAILAEARKRNIVIAEPSHCEYKLGYGLMGTLQKQLIHVGSARFMTDKGISLPAELQTLQDKSHEEGYSLVIVALDKQVVGAIELLPTMRAEAKQVIRLLKNRPNIKSTYIISGDNEIPTRKLAKELGIDHYFAQTLPENKASIIEQLQKEGHFVCYVGDGINDSIALKTAQVSISLTGASKIATDTAQVILMDHGIGHLSLLFDLAENLNANMNTLLTLMIAPCILGVSGVFLLGFGITQVLILDIIGTLAAIGYALFPVPKQLQLSEEISGKDNPPDKHQFD